MTPHPHAARRGRRSFAVTRERGRLAVVAEPPRPTIAIIGAGFSGSLLALHLLRRCPRARIVLIERNRQFGRGLAYATGNDSHLLNVPAGRMSAFHDRPGDFVDWLRRQEAGGRDGIPFDAGSFVPRRLFGAYVRHLLNSELKGGEAGRLELLRGEVIDIVEAGALLLTLDRERAVEAHVAVVALGNFPPEPPPVADPWIYGSSWYKGDPWDCDTLAALDPEAPVLLIGTGLTMVDTTMSLLDNGHRGTVHALSRRGLLPRCHAPQGEAAALLPGALPPSISALTRLLRREIARERENGASWQAIIDALRPVTQELWLSLPPAERAALPAPCAAVVGRASPSAGAGDRAPRRAAAAAGAAHRGRRARHRLSRDAVRHRGRLPHRKRRWDAAILRRRPHHQLRRAGLRFRPHPQPAGGAPAAARPGAARRAAPRPRCQPARRADRAQRRAVAAPLRGGADHQGPVLGDDLGARHPPAMRAAGDASGADRREPPLRQARA